MLDLPLVAAAAAPLFYRLHTLSLTSVLADAPLGLGWFACVGGISLLYGLHSFIWYRPAKYTELCRVPPLSMLGSHPVDVFASLEIVGKVWQGSCLLALLGGDGAAAAVSTVAAAPTWAWALCGVYIFAGQALNMSLYAAIGNAGVYYGWKLGRPVPWCTGFPFNVGLRHPQYVGVVLTILGGLSVLLSESMVRAGLVQAGLAWAGMYVAMSIMEQIADAKDSSKAA